MIEVKMIGMLPGRAMEIVRELRSTGHVQGIDYDFEYHKPENNDWSAGEEYNERYTIFTFYKESLATWFALKYQ
jgi:hypothetical protein